MSQRANLIQNKGLVTSVNELSAPQGSLRQATNVNIDEQDVITPRRGFNDYGNPTDEITSAPIKQLIEYKDRLFRHFESQIEFEDDQGLFNSISGTFNELRQGYRIKWQESKGNMYFTTDEGVKRISLKNNSTLTSSSTVVIDQSGVPKAAYMEGETEDTVGGFLPAQSKVGYRFLFGRKDTNNNLLLGSPSAREIVTNINDRVVTSNEVTVTIDQDTGSIADEDYIVLSTLNSKYTFYFNATGGTVNPPYKSDTFGTNFVEVNVSNVIADDNDVAAVLANEIVSNVSEFDVSLSSNVITITSNEEGDLDDPIALFSDGANLSTVSETVQGSVVEGNAASVNLTLILPANIDENYFVQVYRTPIITVSVGLDLDDIDPGDEANIVFEKAIDSTDIAAGEFTFKDNTPESFRASGAPLYTNEITGEGILQSNDPPPIALDIALFRNSMFYANTKSAHRLEFDMLSVDNYVSGSTRIIVGNSSITRYYTAESAELADTAAGGDFELSGAVSVSQAIDQTARSLVKIINQDSQSPVNAFYLTGSEDLPGQILLEARSLEDDTIYIGVEEESYDDPAPADNIGGEFSPEIPVSKFMERLYGYNNGTDDFAAIQLTGHGYSTGDQVFVSFLGDGDIDAPSDISGSFNVTVIDVNNFYINSILSTSVDSNDMTNGFSLSDSAVFKASFESDNLEVQNRIYFSKVSEPEAVPIANFIDVGAKDEEIKRILALRDNLFVLKDDGIYIVSGTSAPNFSVRLLDNTRIIAPDSAVVLNNQIFCLTEQGVTRITDSGAGVISRGIENLIDEVANANFNFSPNTFGIAYENDRAYLLFMPTESGDSSATQAYRYNYFENTWSRWEFPATCGYVMERDAKLYLGNGSRNYVSQERKNFDRTDHCERAFTIAIVSNGVNNSEIEISNTTDVQISDVITQEQEVTINYLNNRLLRRMDEFDTGITPPASSTMVDSFSAVAGDNMVQKMQLFNDYLVILNASAFSPKTFTINNLKAETESLVDELNDASSPTSIKNYKKPETITYEAYIKEIDTVRNLITVHEARPFLEQDIKVFKHINKVVEWNPQHYGDPSALKQIRTVTIIFDQNNFYDAKARFGSDISQALTDINFQGKGIGYWGDMSWGNPNHYWGGEGNDIPFRTVVPRGKQKCRYLTIVFEHNNAREDFRILGITAEVRPISARAYK